MEKIIKKIGLASFVLMWLTHFPIFSQTRLGLHVTKEELQMWRTRMVGGPYKNANDVSPNSPGDWTRIYSNAEAFRLNPVAYLWKGPVDFEPAGTTYDGKSIAGAIQKALSVNNEPTGNYLGFHFRDAAFVYMVDSKNPNRNAYRNVVKNALLTLASNPNLDFSNPTKWPVTYYRDINPLFEIINFITKAYLAYDYLDIGDQETGTATFTAAERAKLDKWFFNAALFASNEHEWDINRLFTNRATSSDEADYTLARTYSPTTRDGYTLVTHYTKSGPGNTVYGIQQSFNNRRMCSYRLACFVGIKQKNNDLVAKAKKYVKDWVKYSMYPDGTVGEFERWRSNLPDLGWGYTSDIIASAVTIADALARTGDQSLFQYKTRIGKYNTISPNKDKSIYDVIKVMADIASKKVEWYGTNDPKKVGNSDYLIDGYVRGGVFSGQSEWPALHDVWLTLSNLYYKDPMIKSLYMRNGVGMTPYPSRPTSQGKYVVWTGDWGIYPGLLFMFGQTEGNPKPYPGSIVVSPNAAPIVSVGKDISIVLPSEGISIAGNATDLDGTISSYLWTKSSGPNATLINTDKAILTISNLQPGTYVFRLTAKDDKGATGYDEVEVTVAAASNAAPVVSAGKDISVMLPSSGILVAGTATDSDGTISSYIWTKSSGPNATLMNTDKAILTVSNLQPGTYVFRLTAKDDKGATGYDEVEVTVVTASNAVPVVSAGKDISVTLPSSGISIAGTATDSDGTISTYFWSKTSGPNANLTNTDKAILTVSNLETGNYVFRLTAKDDKGATGYDEVKVVVYSEVKTLSVSVLATNLLCNGSNNGKITSNVLGGVEPYSYKWSNGSTASSISNLSPGNYMLIVTDARGTKGTAEALIEQPDKLTIVYAAKNETLQNSDGQIDVTITGGTAPYQYLWSNRSRLEDLNNIKAGEYTITVTDKNKCSVSQKITLGRDTPTEPVDTTTVENPVEVPNQPETNVEELMALHPRAIFSPNGDGLGDETWTIDNAELITGCELVILDESGKRVYKKLSYNNEWDGTINGVQAPEGAYFYIIKCSDTKYTKTGSFRLVR